ncbi:ESX secretion-associated protein EspG [Nocardia acidivorans]|uniref:ESX secretion-associated protein EspG n=1 Tax=Nocardia acidivorans TaxID=404580 RepID=UPI001FDF2066|nr:ESX secretion-associated protein EspG [Nocardia acidivorans]
MLTPEEFALVWTRETELERRPYPLDTLPRAIERTENPGAAPRMRHRYRTDPDLSAALMLCARTDTTTVTLYGECSNPAPRRILAFAAVAQQRAGILVALPDAVSVMICPADQLGLELVEIIGSAPPGRHAPMREPQRAVLLPQDPDTDPDADQIVAPPDSADLAADHFRRKLREPVDGRGFITVTVEPANPLSPPTRHRTWLDFSGDGRYLLTTATDLTLTPMGDAELAEHLVRLARV